MTTYIESRKSLLAKVHIASKDLGLDDETYRDMLADLTGHRSAGDCSDRQLVLVIASLRKRGWNPEYKPAKKARTEKAPKVRPELAALLSKINALRLDTGKSWAYAESIAKNMYGVGLSWCDGEQLAGVITALVKHRAAKHRASPATAEANVV